MSDTCAAAPAKKPQLVNVLAARDQVVDHIEHSVLAQQLLIQRLGSYSSPVAAWAQMVQDILPDLDAGLRDDAAAAARRVWNNRIPRRIKAVRRRRVA